MEGNAKRTVTKSQVKLIHTLSSALGLSELQYRLWLRKGFGVFSSKELTQEAAQELIEKMKREAFTRGVWDEPGQGGRGFEKLEDRPGFATPAQLRCIDSMWRRTSRAPADRRDSALRNFLQRVSGVSDLRFLTRAQASNMICVLAKMEKPRKNRQSSGKGSL